MYGFDVMSAGLSRSKFGAVIGIPLNFQYRSVDAAENKPTVLVSSLCLLLLFLHIISIWFKYLSNNAVL